MARKARPMGLSVATPHFASAHGGDAGGAEGFDVEVDVLLLRRTRDGATEAAPARGSRRRDHARAVVAARSASYGKEVWAATQPGFLRAGPVRGGASRAASVRSTIGGRGGFGGKGGGGRRRC